MNNHTIFDEIIAIENLFAAWREFRRGKRNKADVQEFEFNLENNLFVLRENLLRKTYRPDKYTFFYVRDPKLRPIHKATVKDRVVFQAVFRILYRIFDKKLIYDSYSCRFKKGTHSGVERLRKFLEKTSQNYHRQIFALKCDVRQFFYSIDHDILLNLIKKEVRDIDSLDLIFKIVDSFEMRPNKGLPLGNVTSQLFANIYLNELDQYVKHLLRERFYIRYCDDFVILGLDEKHLANLVSQLRLFLTEKLALSLHPRKIQIRKLSHGIDFLGYVSLPRHRALRTKTKRRIFRRLRKNKEMFERGELSQESFEQSFQSYLGVLKHCKGFKLKKLITEIVLSK